MQKTIVAGMAPPMMGGQLQGMQPHGMQPHGMPQPGMPQPGMPQPGMPQPGMSPGGSGGYPPQPQGGPNKTVMLQPSDGVVSVARTGQALQPAGTGMIQEGATTLFWIVSLIIGIAVGALAYVIVLQTM